MSTIVLLLFKLSFVSIYRRVSSLDLSNSRLRSSPELPQGCFLRYLAESSVALNSLLPFLPFSAWREKPRTHGWHRQRRKNSATYSPAHEHAKYSRKHVRWIPCIYRPFPIRYQNEYPLTLTTGTFHLFWADTKMYSFFKSNQHIYNIELILQNYSLCYSSSNLKRLILLK